jgi:hypothetical protein
MIRSAHLLCAVILVAACVACAPPPPPTTSGGGGQVPRVTCGVGDFQSKIFYLGSRFRPSPGLHPPEPSSFPRSSRDYVGDLGNVFNAASPDFQNTLCTLDAVYIYSVSCDANPADCFIDSWGWWQSMPTTPHGRIVALAAGLWNDATYAKYETDLTQSILPSSGVTYTNAQSCTPSGVCTPIDNLTTALLAALAHEVGHIGWYVESPDPNSFCGGNFFEKSWETPVHRPPQWRELLTRSERDILRRQHQLPDKHKNPPYIEDIDNAKTSRSADLLIYQLFTPLPSRSTRPPAASPPWASAFAAMSPDEDFVETYKFKVLTTASPPLTSVTITVPGVGTANIVRNYLHEEKPDLKTKVDCVQLSF